MYRLAINGYGRIGRSILRALTESDYQDQMQVVAINEPADAETICHLTRFDSTHGRFAGKVSVENECLIVNDQTIQLSHCESVSDIQWQEIDLVLECSGAFVDRASAEAHLQQGAKKVLFSQPAMGSGMDKTIVFGVNQQELIPEDTIISNASCTTNASVPVLKLINDTYGIDCASITTIHSAMNDQPV
ncbi:MAG: erythrose-4-phosphate dehydrogenase, partial [Gammaproteobacteria bacterium]|nr:erythrose-4-phosphate dehydrogenase [Gammaproteobacteria bacterium]